METHRPSHGNGNGNVHVDGDGPQPRFQLIELIRLWTHRPTTGASQ